LAILEYQESVINISRLLQYPKNEYSRNFTSTSLDYSRIYTSSLAAGLKAHGIDTGTVISYNNFGRLYPIFHIDVSEKDLQIHKS